MKIYFSRFALAIIELLRHNGVCPEELPYRRRRKQKKGGHAIPKNGVTAFVRFSLYSPSLQSAHLPQFASSLQSPQSELASGSEQSVHPPWEAEAGAALVVASPVARSSIIPS